MDFKGARNIAEKIIYKKYKDFSVPVLIWDEMTHEFSRGWVFRYNTKEFIETWNEGTGLFTAVPIVIDKFDGKIYRLFNPNHPHGNPIDFLDDYIYRKENELMMSNSEKNDSNIEHYDYYKIPYYTQIEMISND